MVIVVVNKVTFLIKLFFEDAKVFKIKVSERITKNFEF